MKMRLVAVIAAVLGVGVTAALVGLVGCETRSAGEAENYFDNNPYSSAPRDQPGAPALSIDPSDVTVTNVAGMGHVIQFMARGGKEPFSWELAVASAGTIDVQPNTRTALVYLYPRDDFSANVLLVYDSTGNAAVASIVGLPISQGALSVAPSSVELNYDEEMVKLFALGGVPPYTWRVVYPERGAIVRYGVNNAGVIYKRIEEPDQIIIVTDSAGSAVEMTISQPEETPPISAGPLTISVDPTSLDTDGDIALCTATGGTAPYTWTTPNSTSGAIISDPNTGSQVIYQRDAPGDVAIVVTDARRRTATVIISQP